MRTFCEPNLFCFDFSLITLCCCDHLCFVQLQQHPFARDDVHLAAAFLSLRACCSLVEEREDAAGRSVGMNILRRLKSIHVKVDVKCHHCSGIITSDMKIRIRVQKGQDQVDPRRFAAEALNSRNAKLFHSPLMLYIVRVLDVVRQSAPNLAGRCILFVNDR